MSHHQRYLQAKVKKGSQEPTKYLIAEHLEAESAVVAKEVDDGVVEPPAFVLQRLRQVPVVDGDHGRDAFLKKAADQQLVVIDACVQRVRNTHRSYELND